MKLRITISLIFLISFLSLLVIATTLFSEIKITPSHALSETSFSNNTYLPTKKQMNPVKVTSGIDTNTTHDSNEATYLWIIDRVHTLKTIQQQLYQKLNHPHLQQLLMTQFPTSIVTSEIDNISYLPLRHLLKNDIYSNGFTLTLIQDQYLPIINEKEIEKYYFFLTPQQVQSIQVLLNF